MGDINKTSFYEFKLPLVSCLCFQSALYHGCFLFEVQVEPQIISPFCQVTGYVDVPVDGTGAAI